MQQLLKYISFLSISLLTLACEESTDWALDTSEINRLVVEAILTDEEKIQEIRLSQTFSTLSEVPEKVTDATITVAANNITYNFLADADIDGLYKSESPFRVFPNTFYNLEINWENNTYEAQSVLSEVAPIPEITFSNSVDSNLLIFGNTIPVYSPNQQAMYEMDVDWSHISNDSITKAKVLFYTFSSVHINEIVRPNKEPVRFPPGSIVIVKKFGLNDDFADFQRSKAIETEWHGAFFFSNSENLPTNISNNAIGFFSTCAVLTDTLIAE